MPRQLKLAFAGTPALAATVLETLITADAFTISCVYTQPDRPAGRGRKLHKSMVKEVAESNHLLIHQPLCSKEMDIDNKLSQVDVLIVAAYGMLLPESILNRPGLGCINVHTSLLPRWRGAAPIQRAIQAGDRETGITIMQMDAGLDTGDILLQKICTIKDDDTAGSLHDRLAILGAEALLETLTRLPDNSLQRQKQNDEQASYARKISKAEAEIDWTLPAGTIERSIRAFNPSPVAHTLLNHVPMRIWEAEVLDIDSGHHSPGTVLASSTDGVDIATADKVIRIHKLQLPGKKITSASAFHHGHPHFSSSY